MIHGELIGLRARYLDDIPTLQAELYDDVPTRARADSRPWRPIPPGSRHSPYAVDDISDGAACFSVVELASQALAGEAVLWGIDSHNRHAHLGLSLLPQCRGRGLGTDAVRVLCEYGFRVRGLHRLQIETLADNQPMIDAAVAAGFAVEGTLRQSSWVYGRFCDEVVLGLLGSDWNRRDARPRP